MIRAGLAALLVVLAHSVGPVEAGDVKVVVSGAGRSASQRAIGASGGQVVVSSPSRVTVGPSSRVVVNAPSRVVVAPPSQVIVNAPSRIFVRTPPVLAFPVYVAAPRRCLVPGYWAYAWIAQSYAYSAWVDGQYSEEGLWVGGYWEPRIYSSGYYQPYWIPERWSDC
ncbi:MAG: hypothetical protein DME12_08075 [Candidatus Rokuibacteriota bacterium]|nr:MAG: hypothetical protein DME12_08075 [Candidatus Rokubacteria bacterium]